MAIELKFETLPPHTNRKPVVAIVGAGIAGLTLAILLEQQGIDYNIYERARAIKPLGSAMSLGPAVIPLFKQLGIYEEFLKLSKLFNQIQNFTREREPDFAMDLRPGAEMAGYNTYIITRPVLYNLLLSRIPNHRIHLGKKVLTIVQNKKGVLIRTWDNQSHEADILIGADGAYSAVRQGLYASLKAEERLPSSDSVALPYSCVCLVGQTTPLDPEKYPDLKLEDSQFLKVQGPGIPYSWHTITTKQNTLCWSVIQFLNKESSKLNDSFRNSEWGPEAAEAMCKEVRDFPIVGAARGTVPMNLGDVIDLTPPSLVSKVMLEEKVFDTWHGGRTVLIGDACHKINPAGGQGALLAIHDAICIANWISALPSTKFQDVETIFQEYRQERHPPAKAAFKSSQMFRHLSENNLRSHLTRFMSKRTPTWLWKIILSNIILCRPQVSFLPLVEETGTVKAAYQTSLERTLKLHAERRVSAV